MKGQAALVCCVCLRSSTSTTFTECCVRWSFPRGVLFLNLGLLNRARLFSAFLAFSEFSRLELFSNPPHRVLMNSLSFRFSSR